MYRLYSEIEELTHPLVLSDHSSPAGVTNKEVDIVYKSYLELKDVIYKF